MFYEVVGVEQFSGVSKNTGKPFEITTLHLVYADAGNKNLVGQAVMCIRPFSDLLKRCGYYPTVGDKIQLGYVPDNNGVAQLRSITLVDA